MKCLNCDKELTGKWQKKFCSRHCSVTVTNQSSPKRGEGQYRPCLNCKRPRGSGKKYCSITCQHEFNRQKYIERWLLGSESGGSLDGNLSSIVRQYLYNLQRGACAICELAVWRGQNIPLVADHIDGNSSNHSKENVRLICGNCDMQLPTYKSKNKGNGRHYRRSRYQAGKSY